MQLSVIIIGYNSWSYLEKNLESLSFLSDNPESEIWYIDNASTDGTVARIKSQFPFVKIIENKENRGISKARNQGIIASTGRYIWILDSDTVVTQEALSSMLLFMDNNPDVGLSGCKMYGQDGEAQLSCRKFPTIGAKLKAGFHIVGNKLGLSLFPGVFRHNSYDTNQSKPFDVDYVIGACQMIRRNVQQEVGLLDEKIFYGPEDADFCLRIHQAGYRVCYLPDVSIIHAYQRVSSYKIFNKITYKHILGLIHYFRKNRKRNGKIS